MSQWHDPESQILNIRLDMSDALADAEVSWKDKDGGPVMRTLSMVSQIPLSGDAAEVFDTARKAILNVIALIEEGRFSVDSDDEPEDGMGWSA